MRPTPGLRIGRRLRVILLGREKEVGVARRNAAAVIVERAGAWSGKVNGLIAGEKRSNGFRGLTTY